MNKAIYEENTNNMGKTMTCLNVNDVKRYCFVSKDLHQLQREVGQGDIHI